MALEPDNRQLDMTLNGALFLDVPKASATAQNEGTPYKPTTLIFLTCLYVVRGQEALLVDLLSPSLQPVRQKHADVCPPQSDSDTISTEIS